MISHDGMHVSMLVSSDILIVLLQVEIGTDKEKILEFTPALTNCNKHDLRIKSLLQLKAQNATTGKQVLWWNTTV